MLKVKEGTGSGIAYCILLLLMIIPVFFNDAWRIVMYIVGIPLLLYIPSFFKELQMSKDGCLIKVFLWKRFYRWNAFETIRLLDFGQCGGSNHGNAPYFSEGILFCTRRIPKYPVKVDPPTYFLLRDPLGLRSFYIQFPPESAYTTKMEFGVLEYGFYPYRVDRAEFMSKVEEWGLKIEGLNVPMPPEQLAAKKKR